MPHPGRLWGSTHGTDPPLMTASDRSTGERMQRRRPPAVCQCAHPVERALRLETKRRFPGKRAEAMLNVRSCLRGWCYRVEGNMLKHVWLATPICGACIFCHEAVGARESAVDGSTPHSVYDSNQNNCSTRYHFQPFRTHIELPWRQSSSIPKHLSGAADRWCARHLSNLENKAGYNASNI